VGVAKEPARFTGGAEIGAVVLGVPNRSMLKTDPEVVSGPERAVVLTTPPVVTDSLTNMTTLSPATDSGAEVAKDRHAVDTRSARVVLRRRVIIIYSKVVRYKV
jgi:hypothetical protein